MEGGRQADRRIAVTTEPWGADFGWPRLRRAAFRKLGQQPSCAGDFSPAAIIKHDLDFSRNRRGMVKRDSRTIVFDVSSHGFGHLGQIAPVFVELIAQHPTACVVVRSTHAASVVNNILGFHVDLHEPPPEATLVMLDPIAVDIAASAETYRALHARWDEDLGPARSRSYRAPKPISRSVP
jgi:hypothetical protein